MLVSYHFLFGPLSRETTYRLLGDDVLGRGSGRAGRLLHSNSVAVPGVLLSALSLSGGGRFEEVEVEHIDVDGWMKHGKVKGER